MRQIIISTKDAYIQAIISERDATIQKIISERDAYIQTIKSEKDASLHDKEMIISEKDLRLKLVEAQMLRAKGFLTARGIFEYFVKSAAEEEVVTTVNVTDFLSTVSNWLNCPDSDIPVLPKQTRNLLTILKGKRNFANIMVTYVT